MKTSLLVAGGLLCACAWHSNAQEPTANPTTAPQADTMGLDSEGPDMTASSMSGGPASIRDKTRGEVYGDSAHSQQDEEAAWLRKVYKGH